MNERRAEPVILRVATFNIEDLRTEELADPASARARMAASIIQQLRPDILLINEIAYDQAGAPGWLAGSHEGQNGQRFVDEFLAISQGDGLAPIRYRAFMRPSNTGIASGFDLDNNGAAILRAADLPSTSVARESRRQSNEGRSYGADSWGFGTFPGQYGMTLLVGDGCEILTDQVRTFRLLRWSTMPGALRPVDPASGESWYSSEEWSELRLSSKSHWDVPVRLANGAVIHTLASHPTPPAFDGPEERNRKRNHDEIRFWSDYLDGASYIVDDDGKRGGLEPETLFVIVGDLNADPQAGRSLGNPVGRWLLEHSRVLGDFVPRADSSELLAGDSDLDPADTTTWSLRVDYVLPARGLQIANGGVRRPRTAGEAEVSDHFPVWIDLVVPSPLSGTPTQPK